MKASFFSKRLGAIDLLQCRPLASRGVPHGFTLRTRGFGRRDNGPSDWIRLSEALGVRGLAAMKQVHGATIRIASDPGEAREGCDGLVTDRPGLGVVVQSADCLPLLYWDGSGRNAVAAVHAGWRGTLSKVASAAVRKLERDLGCAPGELHVAIGPAIRACCFEVGDEVVAAFAGAGRDLARIVRPGSGGRRHIDLIEDNRQQLLQCGVAEDRIYDSGRCTRCENERFYSYRKEGKGVGRLMGVIAPI